MEYKTWQKKAIPISPALLFKCIEIFRDRIAKGMLEEGYRLYRNPWFLVAKKDGRLYLINDIQLINKITIRDMFCPPGAETYIVEFVGCQILLLLDLFSGYNQVELDEFSRDLITILTPLGLLQQTTLLQGITNSSI